MEIKYSIHQSFTGFHYKVEAAMTLDICFLFCIGLNVLANKIFNKNV